MTQTNGVISVEYKDTLEKLSTPLKHHKCVFVCFPDLLKVIADPERDWCAPVTVPRNRPVPCVSQPVPETLLTNKLWNPAETERS